MSTPIVGAYVKIPADCNISFSFEADDLALLPGNLHDGFEIIFERAALARFVEMAQQALSTPVEHEKIGALTPAAVM